VKILVLCYEYPPVGGGGGRVAEQVAAGLVRRGHEVRVLTSGMRHLPRRELRDGVTILRPESFRRREDTCSVAEMFFYLATGFLPMLRQIFSWKPDVVHAHFAVPTGVLAWTARLFTRMPYVITAHLGDVPGGVPEQTEHLYRLLNPFLRPVWRGASRVTAVSHFVAGLAARAYGAQPVVIPNGVKPLPEPSWTPHTPVRIVMVGRLSIQKNPLLAVESLKGLTDIPWKFDVIGEGPLGEEMRARVKAENLGDRVTFHGWLSGDRTAAILREADILLMPSLHEGLPMAGIEALQHGLAIVGGAIGGLRDVVRDGANGFLCALDAPAFAARLRELVEQPDLLARLRRASRAMAADFDLESSVRAYEQVLLDAARPPA